MGGSVCICIYCNPEARVAGHPPTVSIDSILCEGCYNNPAHREPTERKFMEAEEDTA